MRKETNRLYEFGMYRLDAENRALFFQGQAIALPPKAVELLTALIERNGQVVSKDQLMELLWRDTIVEEANLTQNIFLLRKVFSENGDRRKWIETIPRRGYRFVGEVKALLPATNNATIDSSLQPIEGQTFAQALTEADKDKAAEVFPEPSRQLPAAARPSLWHNRKV